MDRENRHARQFRTASVALILKAMAPLPKAAVFGTLRAFQRWIERERHTVQTLLPLMPGHHAKPHRPVFTPAGTQTASPGPDQKPHGS